MSNEDVRKLCEKLMHIDTESEMVGALKDAGYWDDDDAWRDYGDSEDNISTIGGQQSRAEYALVEKLTNSIDATLINQCYLSGIRPQSPEAPKSIRDGVARFYDEASKGYLQDWTEGQRTKASRNITLSTTGTSPNKQRDAGVSKPVSPCINIADCGEGQTPDGMPKTILSIHKGNKRNIAFVQGEYNQGGTGVLEFCGRKKMQFVLTRRNPAILDDDHSPDDLLWSFTVVRREAPKTDEKRFRYTYLAPLKQDNSELGALLRFSADSMPIFPESNKAYARESEWGTLIKLIEFRYPAHGHILRQTGLLYRLDMLLPEMPLPIRLHECREGYGGKPGSFHTPIAGLRVRLDKDETDKKVLEEGFPDHVPFRVKYDDDQFEDLTAGIFLFKKDQHKAYKQNQGLLYTYNGQVHTQFDKRFFRTKDVGLDFIDKSLLVFLDCSKLSQPAKADILMTSRDRSRDSDFHREVHVRLKEILSGHMRLREVRNERQEAAQKERIADSKPLEDVLKNIITRSPTLSMLFAPGQRLSSAFKRKKVKAKQKHFDEKQFPTYFRLKGKSDTKETHKTAHLGQRFRVQFETDAEREYFQRRISPGQFELFFVNDGEMEPVLDYTGPYIFHGLANVNISLPDDRIVGDEVRYVATVTDDNMGDFTNEFIVDVKPAQQSDPNKKKRTRVRPPSDEEGDDRTVPAGISLPEPVPVYEKDWEDYDFNQYSALRVSQKDSDHNKKSPEYYFFVNMDNEYLKHELKGSKEAAAILKAQFSTGMTVIGLAMLNQHKMDDKSARSDESDQGIDVLENITQVSTALSPFLIPLVRELGRDDFANYATDEGSDLEDTMDDAA